MRDAESTKSTPSSPGKILAETGSVSDHPVVRALKFLRNVPFTVVFILTLIAVGIITGTLTSRAHEQDWFTDIATGLPAFKEGRWWTIFTSPFFIEKPRTFFTILPLSAFSIGWAELRFGWLRTMALAIGGHIVGVLGGAGVVAFIAQGGWPWAVRLSLNYDVGPSCAAFTALVFVIATLPAPWRLRGRIAVILWTGISLLYLGHLSDIEHAVTMVVALVVSGFIPAFRHPAGRPSEREWRLIALAGMVAVGAIQLLDLIVPYDGPLGHNNPTAGAIDVAIDVVIIALIANGLRQGYRVAWFGAIGLGLLNIFVGIAALTLVPWLLEIQVANSPIEIVALVLSPTILWTALLVLLIAARGAFRVPIRRSRRRLAAPPLSRDEYLDRLEHFGGGTISWMSTWESNQRIAVGRTMAATELTTTTGATPLPPVTGQHRLRDLIHRRHEGPAGAIAYQDHAGVAIALGDPIGPPGDLKEGLADFARATERAGLVPCVFSATEAAAAVRPAGWRSVVVAEDTIVDLPELKFTGKAWGDVRTAINRAGREGIEFKLIRLADAPWNVLAQVRAISEQWSGDKGLPEMRFTLGTVAEALDPEVWLGVAVDAEGSLHGVTSWLPVFGPAEADSTPRIVGWTLDLMRRRDGGFGPVMEFLIASSAKQFAEEGYLFVSLSGAPLVRPADASSGPVEQVLEQIGALIEPLYGFKSLHRYKQKFSPRAASLHLLYRDEGDLPRIGIALTRAYLPDATLRDLLSTGRGGEKTERSRGGAPSAKAKQ